MLVTILFYEEKSKDLISFVSKFLNNNKIRLSMEFINLLVNRAGGERQNLNNELRKILSIRNEQNIDLNYKKTNSLSEITKLVNWSINIYQKQQMS